ncbi:MAG: hypothetical protein EBZ48_09740 [Proteobacteria bacterium]|nr:hypothetical protein [Pseudomonadota bacterium]
MSASVSSKAQRIDATSFIAEERRLHVQAIASEQQIFADRVASILDIRPTGTAGARTALAASAIETFSIANVLNATVLELTDAQKAQLEKAGIRL